MIQEKSQAKGAAKGNSVAIMAMFFLFAMISFVTNLAAPIGTIWQGHYAWAGMVGNFMNFLAYLLMGIPAGNMLTRIGYKKTALVAVATGAVGVFVQWLSSVVGESVPVFDVQGSPLMLNYVIYLLGAFIGGFSVCMLNTVVNPMLNMLGGGGNKGNQLIQLGGSLNSLAGTLTPLFVGMLIGQVTASTSMADVSPLLWIAIAIFVLAFIIISFVKIPEPHISSAKSVVKTRDAHSPWSFRHFVLGAIGIFFYVGLEVGIAGELIFYLSDSSASGLDPKNATAVAGAVAAVYWLLMLVGRLSSSLISGKVSSRAQLIAASGLAIILIVLAIITSSTDCTITMPAYSVEEGFSFDKVPLAALFLVLCGLCTSVMWGGIFNLAVEGLGKYTAKASGIFMMMVVGGGVMPLIQNAIAGAAGYMTSYWLVVAMLAYLLYYSVIGSKNVNTYISVDDENRIPDSV